VLHGSAESEHARQQSLEGKGNERADARHRHEATANSVFAGNANQQVVKLSKCLSQRSTNNEQRLHNEHQFGVVGKLACPSLEVSGGGFAEITANVAKEPSNIILQVEELRPEQLSRSKNRMKALARGRLDVD
jgi:hypothetical protein